MAKIVNLSSARKAKDRDKARAKADENAVKYGRTAGQKAREAADQARAQAALDGVKREEDPG